jgi:hypothetical protein
MLPMHTFGIAMTVWRCGLRNSSESFRITHLEASSQCLRMLHFIGGGVSGLFNNASYAIRADPHCPYSKSRCLTTLIAQVPTVRTDFPQAARRYCWQQVANSYNTTYQPAEASVMVSRQSE